MVKLFFVSIFKLNEDKTKVRRKTPIQELKDLDEKTVYVVSNTYIQLLMAQKNKFTPTPRKNPNRLMHKFHKEKLSCKSNVCDNNATKYIYISYLSFSRNVYPKLQITSG